MSEPLLLGIDEGTTAVKAALFDLRLRPLALARREVATSHPHPGWVEQDPLAVLESVESAVAQALAEVDPARAVLAGLAHQGESVLAWDARSGEPLTPIVVWQDKRQQELLAEIDPSLVSGSGLPLDPYFSAGKLAWLVRQEPEVRTAAREQRLRMGTVDAFLADRLGGRFASDLSTASRTQLLALGGHDWDPRLLSAFGLRREWLPAIGPTAGELGRLRSERWPLEMRLCAQAVDQQAALAGSGCVDTGTVKATYGTGVFVLARTERPVLAAGLLPTVAWSLGPERDGVAYALDGGVFTAGALLEWMTGELGLAEDVPQLARLAAQVSDSEGVRVLPALAGLGSPWWRPAARGVIAGLHGGAGRAHVARAALEAIAHRVVDVIDAIGAVAAVEELRVDGGLSNDPTLLSIQADLLGAPLAAGHADATALGAAMLAAVGGGALASLREAAAMLEEPRRIAPRLQERERLRERERWRRFVAAAAEL